VVDHSRHDNVEVGLQKITVDEVVTAALAVLKESQV